MNPQLNPERIRQLLNRSTNRLDEATLTRLREARLQAMQRHAVRHESILAHAGPGHHGSWQEALQHHKLFRWIAGALLVASLLSGIAYWQHSADNDTSDEDIAILTDDLPLQVYVD